MGLIEHKCRACGEVRLRRLFTVAHIPVTGYVVPDERLAQHEPSFDLTLSVCERCGLTQLEGDDFATILTEKVYSQYQATYSLSLSVQQYMRNLLQSIHARYHISEDDTFLEIGCNDGRNLEMARELPCRVLGVEASGRLASLARARNVPVLEAFFDRDVGTRIADEYGPARLVLARHVLEHVFNLREFVSGLRECMDARSILIIEVPYIVSILQGFHYEGIAHPHVSYFSVRSLRELLSAVEIEIISAECVPSDGGSILVQAHLRQKCSAIGKSVGELLLLEKALRIDMPQPYQLLERRICGHRLDVVDLLQSLKAMGKRIYGFGAGKGHTLMNVLHLDSSVVSYIIDDDQTKQGKFLPGCAIKVQPSTLLLTDPPDYLLILAPTHATELKAKIDMAFPERRFTFIDIVPEINWETHGGLEGI